MAETTEEKLEEQTKPVFCNTCGTMYDEAEGKSIPHIIIDDLKTPKKAIKRTYNDLKQRVKSIRPQKNKEKTNGKQRNWFNRRPKMQSGNGDGCVEESLPEQLP